MSTIDQGWASVPAWRIYTNWLAFAVCVVLAMLALEQIARYQLINHLDDKAGAILGALIHADTPHRWQARDKSNIVAGKAFGTSVYSFDSQGMNVRSQGDAIEIGLALSGAIDLKRYANLDVGIASESAASMSVVIRSSLDLPACSSEPIELPSGDNAIAVNLRRLDWTCEGLPAPPPDRAEMLRLRLLLETASTLTLNHVEARTSMALSASSLDQLQLPLLPTLQDPHAFERTLDRASSDIDGRMLPLLQLSTDARVEQTLLARDLVDQRIADAIIVAGQHFPDVARRAREWNPPPTDAVPAHASRWLLGLYALALVWIRLKPVAHPRLRALLELLGVTAIPIALVAGGAIGDDIDEVILGAGAATLVFALSLLIGSAPAQPGSRTLKRGWWVALFSIGLALGVVFATTGGHVPETPPEFSQILHYLLWAAVLQFVICVIVAERVERITGSVLWAGFGAALIFALLTTPNAMLMQLSFAGGLIWVWNWQHHRALLANIVAQTVCALLLVSALPADWLYSGEVSARFFMN